MRSLINLKLPGVKGSRVDQQRLRAMVSAGENHRRLRNALGSQSFGLLRHDAAPNALITQVIKSLRNYV